MSNFSYALTLGWLMGRKVAGQRPKYEPFTPGLYETGTTTLTYSWNDMLTDGVVSVTDGVVTDNYGDQTASLAGDLVLPGDGSVTEIGEYFFYGSAITKVTIPEGITTIQAYAFEDCNSLTAIRIPASATSIGWIGLQRCDALSTVHIASDNTTYFSSKNHVYSSDGLTLLFVPRAVSKYEISDTVQYIGDHAFYLHNITSVGIVGSGCTLELPNSIQTIGEYTFSYCASLTGIDLPESVQTIGESAFRDCTSLVNVNIKDKVTKVGEFAFSGCLSLNAITLPDTITSLGSAAFIDCTALTTVNIPNQITDLANSMFSGCTSLKSITIPSAIAEISPYAFKNCTSLTTAIFEVTSGWYVRSYSGDGTAISVASASAAAKLLRDTYANSVYYIYRNV